MSESPKRGRPPVAAESQMITLKLPATWLRRLDIMRANRFNGESRSALIRALIADGLKLAKGDG